MKFFSKQSGSTILVLFFGCPIYVFQNQRNGWLVSLLCTLQISNWSIILFQSTVFCQLLTWLHVKEPISNKSNSLRNTFIMRISQFPWFPHSLLHHTVIARVYIWNTMKGCVGSTKYRSTNFTSQEANWRPCWPAPLECRIYTLFRIIALCHQARELLSMNSKTSKVLVMLPRVAS